MMKRMKRSIDFTGFQNESEQRTFFYTFAHNCITIKTDTAPEKRKQIWIYYPIRRSAFFL